MKFAIIGAGGIGGYLAAKLVAAGAEVAVLARGAHLAAIRDNGLTLREPEGEVTVRPAIATDDGAELGVADVAIFAVKGQDLAAAIEAARPAIGPQTLALPFLNGVEAPALLADAFGADRSLIGIARISAFIAGPGVIQVATPWAEFLIGGPDGRQDAPRVAEIIGDFRASGIVAPERQDVRIDLWQKLVFLTALSGTTAAARADLGTVRKTPELWALFRRLAEEAASVGRARGIALADNAVEMAIQTIEKAPDDVRASLAHDLGAGKRLETDWLNGAVVRLGAEVGVEAPAHATIAALLAPWREGGGQR
ncbi:MAG TPA: 2-dehydropantoate 2-reductase [Thermohalobaculum sp.]|nr:2-dehydropantoate 2-reductase [Thermohalobaculum sp.]